MNGGKDPSISLCRLRTGGSKAVQTDTETGPLKKPKKTLQNFFKMEVKSEDHQEL